MRDVCELHDRLFRFSRYYSEKASAATPFMTVAVTEVQYKNYYGAVTQVRIWVMLVTSKSMA